jgi:hypothetical protein
MRNGLMTLIRNNGNLPPFMVTASCENCAAIENIIIVPPNRWAEDKNETEN